MKTLKLFLQLLVVMGITMSFAISGFGSGDNECSDKRNANECGNSSSCTWDTKNTSRTNDDECINRITKAVMANIPDQNAEVGNFFSLNIGSYVTWTDNDSDSSNNHDDNDGDSSNNYALSGILPPGLSFNKATGVIDGIPTTSGVYTLKVMSNDSEHDSDHDGYDDNDHDHDGYDDHDSDHDGYNDNDHDHDGYDDSDHNHDGYDDSDGHKSSTENSDTFTITVTSNSLSISANSTTEGNSGTKTLNFTITRSVASQTATTVKYTTSDASATAGSDYSAVTDQTITIPAGSTTATASVTINGDTTVEPNETFTVTLSAPTNATLATASATAIIIDDDSSGGLSYPGLGQCSLFPSAISTRETLHVAGHGESNNVVFNVKNINAREVEGDKIKCTLESPSNGVCNGNGRNSEDCTCTVLAPPPAITLPTFIASEGGTKSLISPVTLEDAGDITMGSSLTSLTLQASSPYGNADKKYMKIGKLKITANNVNLTLTEGDYWIESLNVEGNNFNLTVQGSVRLFINEDININGNSTQINASGDAKNVLIFGYHSVNFNANGGGKSNINAFWYLKESMTNNMSAAAGTFTGGFTANGSITIDKNQDFVYPSSSGLPNGFGECSSSYEYAAGAFDAVDSESGLNGVIKTKIVNKPFSLKALSLNSGRTAALVRTISVDASLAKKTSATTYEIAKSLGTVTFTNASSVYLSSITHTSAAKDLRVLFRYCKDSSNNIYSWNGGVCGTGKTTTFCFSGDNFAVRPDSFSISDIATPNLLKSGNTQAMTLHAYRFGDTTNTPDYNVTSANTVLTQTTTKYNKNNTVDGTMAGTTTVNPFDILDGLSQNVGFTFSDVGKINIALQDQNWSDVDSADGSTADCDGRYVCGSTTVTFIPDHFDFNTLSISNNDGTTNNFTYLANEFAQMSGRIATRIRALNSAGAVTQNFATAPLWENALTVTPVVRVSAYLHPDANETTINNLALGFGMGTKTIPWDETNALHQLRFNFQRDLNLPANPFSVSGTDLNISVTSPYTDGGTTVTVRGDRNASANGTAQFVYGRFIPRDVRVFGDTVDFSANGWYEVYNTSTLGGVSLAPSRNAPLWFVNGLHNDTTDGSSSVSFVNGDSYGSSPTNGASVGGIETYSFVHYPIGGYKAHMSVNPWLWFGERVSPYLAPSGGNSNCLTHPCFNISVAPAVGASGSAKSDSETTKSSKSTTPKAGGTWKSTSDYAPAIR